MLEWAYTLIDGHSVYLRILWENVMVDTFTSITAQGNHFSGRMASPPGDMNAVKVLLVEDNTADSYFTLKALNSSEIPYKLDCISDGSKVLSYLENSEIASMPDLIILDLGLPGTNGFEILERLSKAHATIRAIPIVITTGYPDFKYLREMYDLPIYDYLEKPVSTKKISALLDKIHAPLTRQKKAAP